MFQIISDPEDEQQEEQPVLSANPSQRHLIESCCMHTSPRLTARLRHSGSIQHSFTTAILCVAFVPRGSLCLKSLLGLEILKRLVLLPVPVSLAT